MIDGPIFGAHDDAEDSAVMLTMDIMSTSCCQDRWHAISITVIWGKWGCGHMSCMPLTISSVVCQVDTHVHHSACMHQKHLLRFIKSKLRKEPNELVIFRDGKYLTLAEVFESLKLTG